MHQRGYTVVSIAICLCLLACSPKSGVAPTATPSPRSTPHPTIAASEPSDDSQTQEETKDEDDSSEDNSDTEGSEAGYFHGHRCTVDCSGHEAGYRWAEEHDIHDPDDCGGKSQSFIEGCQAWAGDNP